MSLKQDWQPLIWFTSANDVTYQGFLHKTMACLKLFLLFAKFTLIYLFLLVANFTHILHHHWAFYCFFKTFYFINIHYLINLIISSFKGTYFSEVFWFNLYVKTLNSM